MSFLNLVEQASTPATPTTNHVRIYVGPSGLLRSIDDAGVVTTYDPGLTAEQVQDIVGALMIDSASIDFDYDDTANTLTATVLPAGVDHDALANFVANEHIDHSTVSISAGTGLTGGGTIAANRTISLANTAVTPSTYGSASSVPQIAVDAQGRITGASSVSISVPSSAITDFTEAAQDAVGNILTDSASVDFTYNDALNTITAAVLPAGVDHNSLSNYVANRHIDHSAVSISAGTGLTGGGDITASRSFAITATGVTAASYGTASQIGSFSVNAQGQLTSASNVAIAIPSTAVTDFAEAVDDRVAALVIAGAGISVTYNDPANTLTIASTITQYTDEQAQDATASLIQNGTGISWSYNDVANTLTPTVTLSPFSTTNLAEGTNLYYTSSRFDTAFAGKSTTNLAEGTNLYYTSGRFDTAFAAKSTTNLAEGTNLYFTDERAQDAVGAILTDSASVDFTYNDAGNTISAAVLPAGVNHDALANFVANEHIDHTSVSISAGTGLTGGGDISANRSISMPNVGTAGTYGSAILFPIITTDAQGRVSAVTTSSPFPAVSITSTADVTTTSATFALIGSMTTTPAAGEYIVFFSCSAAIAVDSNGDISLFIAGVEQTATRRTIEATTSGAGNTTAQCSLTFTTLINVNGSQAVTVQFRENGGGTMTIKARELILTKI